jgi:hypothetical protein
LSHAVCHTSFVYSVTAPPLHMWIVTARTFSMSGRAVKPRVVRNALAIVDPLAFDRDALLEVRCSVMVFGVVWCDAAAQKANAAVTASPPARTRLGCLGMLGFRLRTVRGLGFNGGRTRTYPCMRSLACVGVGCTRCWQGQAAPSQRLVTAESLARYLCHGEQQQQQRQRRAATLV